MKPEPSPIEDPIVKIEPDSDGETAGKRKRIELIVPDSRMIPGHPKGRKVR